MQQLKSNIISLTILYLIHAYIHGCRLAASCNSVRSLRFNTFYGCLINNMIPEKGRTSIAHNHCRSFINPTRILRGSPPHIGHILGWSEHVYVTSPLAILVS